MRKGFQISRGKRASTTTSCDRTPPECGSRLHRSQPQELGPRSRQPGHRRLARQNKCRVETGLVPFRAAEKYSVQGVLGQCRGLRRGEPRLYREYPPPPLEPPTRQRYSVYALAPSHLLIPHHQLARNCCSVCATKGGVWTSTPI